MNMFALRHASRIRVDDTDLEFDAVNAQEAAELCENLWAFCEIDDTTTSFTSGQTKNILFSWTSVTNGIFDSSKGDRLKLGYVVLTGPNEMGAPSGTFAQEGCLAILRPQTSSDTAMKICSTSGFDYTGAHFDDVRSPDVYSFRVFDSNNRIYLSNAWIDGDNGIRLEFTNASTTTTTIDLKGSAVAWC